MTRRTPILTLLLGLVLAVVLALLLPVGSPAQAASRADTARPKVGDCHDLSTAQIAEDSDSSATVSCQAKHTTEVVAVPNLPKSVKFDGSRRFVDAAEGACTKPFGTRVARGDFLKIAQSAFDFAIFVPTAAQQEQGAHWVRCDAFLLGPRQPEPLHSKSPFLPRTVPNQYSRCADAKYNTVTCDHPHSYRSAFAFRIDMSRPPSDKQAARIAAQRCPRHTGKVYLYTHTSGAVFKAGWRTFDCLRKTKH